MASIASEMAGTASINLQIAKYEIIATGDPEAILGARSIPPGGGVAKADYG